MNYVPMNYVPMNYVPMNYSVTRTAATVVALVVLVFSAPALHGQSAARMDQILAQERLSYGEAAYFIMGALGHVSDDVDTPQVLDELSRRDMQIEGRTADDPLLLGEFSLLLMRALEIEGGILYTLTEEPRYAARELEYLDVIQGRAFPRIHLSGERGVRILGRALSLREEGRL